ncbi:Protein of unknown function [Pyronema omphalodes CBS 100304]|uniref:Uncharacterized protein n=1 Tax=Pyronema omphalodes (strain CBS 100304) TaxID=1076935 RepID=U4KXC1_PYROM|nr:Protein of unknown function [Pyronema omphalodes CBS 100304]
MVQSTANRHPDRIDIPHPTNTQMIRQHCLVAVHYSTARFFGSCNPTQLCASIIRNFIHPLLHADVKDHIQSQLPFSHYQSRHDRQRGGCVLYPVSGHESKKVLQRGILGEARCFLSQIS